MPTVRPGHLPADGVPVSVGQWHVVAVVIFCGPLLAGSTAALHKVFGRATWTCSPETCRYAYISTHKTDGIKTAVQ